MVPARTQTVFGFGSGLDWRPTLFLEPFAEISVCSVCRMVAPLSVLLPCRHTMCCSCCGHDNQGGADARCPLDKKVFGEEELAWSCTMSEGDLLGRRVRCWNAKNGCDVEDMASAVLEHFAKSCRFHSVNCRRCGVKLLHRDVADHLETCTLPFLPSDVLGDNFVNSFSEVREALDVILAKNAARRAKIESSEEHLCAEQHSTTPVPPAIVNGGVTDAPGGASDSFRALLDRHRRKVVSEIKGALAESERAIIGAFAPQCDRIVQTVNGMASEASDVEREKGEDVATIQAWISSVSAAMRNRRESTENEAAPRIYAAPGSRQPDAKRAPKASGSYEWIVGEWASFVAEDASKPLTLFVDAFKCVYGHRIVVELTFSPKTGMVHGDVYALQGGGSHDEPLFDSCASLQFVHPRDPKNDFETALTVIYRHSNAAAAGHAKKYYDDEAVRVMWRSVPNVFASELERRGLVKNNALRLRFNLCREFYSGAGHFSVNCNGLPLPARVSSRSSPMPSPVL
ncbi:uncharacterized protein LOC142589634 [Dermacentor variabilis]|uniref:uncharacterized protein LOC142589634 n=1 Tax=Dermacentor variabilis TaxID=34621 RepID=UPI003F5B5FA2